MTTPLIKEFNIEDSTLVQFGLAGPRIETVQITDSSYNVLDDTAANTGSTGVGTYIVITGSGFDTSSIVIVGNTNTTLTYTQANSTTYVSSTQLRALIPPKPTGFYNLYVQNGDGATAVRINGIQYSDFPVWPNFGSLILKPKLLNYPFNYNFSSSPTSNTLIYSVANGSTIPANTTLLANGYYYGIPNTVGSSTNMYIDVKDQENQNTVQYYIDEVGNGDSEYYRTTMHLVGPETTKFNSDMSPSNHSFRTFGDIRPAAFHPYGDNWSYFFDGIGDYMTIPDNDFLNFLNLDFSVECWFLSSAAPGTCDLLTKRASSSTTAGFRLGFGGTAAPIFQATVNGSTFGVNITSSVSIRLGQWNHLACTRVGDTWTIYVNGVSGGTATLSGTIPRNTAVFGIGAATTTNVVTSSLISDVRVQFGASAYSAAFTPPTSKLQATPYTVLLTLQDNYLVDRGNRNFTITKVNDVAAKPYGPFGDNTSYNNTDRIGSTFFDGTGDYMLADPGNSPDFEFGTGDFTIEVWVYYTGAYSAASQIYDTSASGDATATGRLALYMTATNGFLYVLTGASTNLIVGNQIPRNVWTHILVARSGTSLKAFINGRQTAATATTSVNFITKANRPVIGANGFNISAPFFGYMHGLRVLKGRALWTANTPPPTAPRDVEPNTSLLMMQTYDGENNKRLVDISKTASLTTYPAAQNGPVGSFSPFSPYGYSVFFDGTATTVDQIQVAANSNLYLSNYDHCIEWWMHPATDQKVFAIPFSYNGGASGNGNGYYFVHGFLPISTLYVAGGTNVSTNTSLYYAPYLNKWSHWCITRSGNSFRVFVDGVLAGRANNTITFANQSAPLTLGGPPTIEVNEQWKGWMSNFRVTINSVPALYQTTETIGGTQVFTPPTEPLTVEANTKLLLLADNRFRDKSNNNFAVTRNGDNTKIIPFGPFRGTTVYQPHLHGASWLAQDAGNYFTVPYSKELFDWWQTGSGVVVPYTIELWFYAISLPVTTTVPHIIGSQTVATTTTYWSFGLRAAGTVVFQYNNGTSQYVVSTKTVKPLEWNHLAVTITSSGIRVWVNGEANPAVAISGTPNATLGTVPLSIGAFNNATMLGYYSNLRIVKGDAIYTANSAPPTAPVTRTANTVLLMNFDTGGIVDYTTRHNVLTIADPKSWPAPSRGGGTYNTYKNRYSNTSLWFDGTGDYLQMAPARSETENFGAGDWCIEFWVYRYGATQQTIYDQRSATTQNSPLIYLTTSNNVRYYMGGADRISTAAITSNTWVHVAVERYSRNVSIYINGTRSGAIWLDANNHTVNAHYIGGTTTSQPYYGHLQDFRITRGARYTANLTNEMYQSYPIGY
jgi:hypothetical protein